MADEMLRMQLERDIARFTAAGMDDYAEKARAKLADLEPKPKAAPKAATTKEG